MTFQRTEYPYCKHCVYVGGCGVDYMCFDCEMDDGTPLPTPREFLTYSMARARQLEEMCDWWEDLMKTHPDPNQTIKQYIQRSDVAMAFRTSERQYDFARTWATDMDTPDWLERKWEADAEAWDRMEGEDQFYSLPDHVLDGA